MRSPCTAAREQSPLPTTRESLHAATKIQHNQKIKQIKEMKLSFFFSSRIICTSIFFFNVQNSAYLFLPYYRLPAFPNLFSKVFWRLILIVFSYDSDALKNTYFKRVHCKIYKGAVTPPLPKVDRTLQ